MSEKNLEGQEKDSVLENTANETFEVTYATATSIHSETVDPSSAPNDQPSEEENQEASQTIKTAEKTMATARSIDCPYFNFGSDAMTLSSRWEKWLWLWENYLIANGLDEMDTADPTKYKGNLEKMNKAKFMLLIGDQVMQVYDAHCKRTDCLTETIKKLTEHFTPLRNTFAEICQFSREKSFDGESVNEFIMRLRQAAAHCDFKSNLDAELQRQFVLGCNMTEVTNKVALKSATPMTWEEIVTYALSIESRDTNVKAIRGPPGPAEVSGHIEAE